jgi:hypothetical protein
MDQIRDMYNMVHACEIANEAEKDITIRRASGFNELFQAVMQKECEEGEQPDAYKNEQQSGSQVRPELEGLKSLIKDLIAGVDGMIATKWTWGVDLDEDDLLDLIRGADRDHEVPHSGYDEELPSGSLRSPSSGAPDPTTMEDPNDPNILFDAVSIPITIRELDLDEILKWSDLFSNASGDDQLDADPDPVIDAYTKRAKAEARQANKQIMQDEVNHPVSYLDYGSEFDPKVSLIPRRPWLAHIIPKILPPTNIQTDRVVLTDPNSDEDLPDHIDIPDSDDIPDHIEIPNSDEIPDHIDIPESDDFPESDSNTSQVDFPVSDDEMDVDESVHETNTDLASEKNSDSASEANDDIVFPSDSPRQTTTEVQRDPLTGRFTAASFAKFSDALLDQL